MALGLGKDTPNDSENSPPPSPNTDWEWRRDGRQAPWQEGQLSHLGQSWGTWPHWWAAAGECGITTSPCPQLWVWFPISEQQEMAPYYPVIQSLSAPSGRDDFLCIRSPLIKTSKVIQGRTRRGSPALLHVTVRGQAPALLIAWKPSSSQKGVPLGPGSVGRLWAGTAYCGLSALTLILAVLFGHLVWNMTKHIIYPYWGYTIWPIDSISSWNQKLVID